MDDYKIGNHIKPHPVQWTPEKVEAVWEIHITDHELSACPYPADFYKVVLQRVEKYLKPSMRCLDMGCGTGTLIRLLHKKGYQVNGVDISSHAIEHMRRTFRQNDVKVGLFACPLHQMPFKEGTFDVIFTTEVLEHLEYDYAISVLREVRRILSAKGIIIATTPYCERFVKVICPDCMAKFHPMGHVQSFDKHKAAELLGQTGFKVMGLFVFSDLFIYPDDNFTKVIMKRVMRRVFRSLMIKLRGHNLLWVGQKN